MIKDMKMKLKKLFQYGFIAAFLIGNTFAMEDNSDKLLVVGCKPWDANIQEVKSLGGAHFVDFMIQGAPEQAPAKFHHFDVNDVGAYSEVNQYYNGPLAGKFSEFATTNPEKFNTIIIDWMTYHHIRRDGAWTDFAALLSPGGKLIVPVTKSNTSGSISKQTAQEIIDSKLTNLFGAVEILSHDTMPNDIYFDLLRRNGVWGITECALSFTPAIIVATK
jgi:hypothetical protein